MKFAMRTKKKDVIDQWNFQNINYIKKLSCGVRKSFVKPYIFPIRYFLQ